MTDISQKMQNAGFFLTKNALKIASNDAKSGNFISVNVETSACKTSDENADVSQFEVFHRIKFFVHREVFHPKRKFRTQY